MPVYRKKDKNGNDRSPLYYYDFRWKGRRFSGSTGETTKRKAEAVEKRLREDVKTPPDDTTIDGSFQRWWEEKGEGQSSSISVWGRLERLQDMLEDLLTQEDKPLTLASVTTDHLAKYVALRSRQLNRFNKLPAPATINREIQLLRMVMRRAVFVWEKQFILPNFGEVLEDEPEELTVELTEATYAAIQADMRPDYHDVMDFLVLAANRAGNVLVRSSRILAPEDVDFKNMEVTFYVKSKKPGGRKVVLPITQPMLVILANNINNHPKAVFTYLARRSDKKKGRIKGQRYPITSSAFYQEFKKAARKNKRPELRVHDLRHTGATWVLRKTKNLKVAQQLLGHTRITTTAKYAHVLKDDLRRELEAAHNRHQNPTETEDELPNPLKLNRNRE